MNTTGEISQMIDGNSKNNFFLARKDLESLEHVILCGLNKVKDDAWLLKLENKKNKTQSCKRLKKRKEILLER